MDEVYLGGEQPGIRGRDSPNKASFLAAIETREGRPWCLQMRRVEGFSRKARDLLTALSEELNLNATGLIRRKD